jgi:DNA-binding transcriptional LysR family regulator
MAINELRSVTTFIKAAELGSLRKAALDLDISPQAASKALAQLEKHLEVRLFHRTTRVMSLTDAGQRLLEDVQPALLGVQRALKKAKSTTDEIAGPLRITGPRTTFQPILWALIEEFCDRYPGIQPDVLLEDRVGNWVEDRVDVGFHMGRSPHEGVIARKLFPLQLLVCGSPDYFARYGVPDSLAALANHRCSVFRHPGTGKLAPWHLRLDHHQQRRNAGAACRVGWKSAGATGWRHCGTLHTRRQAGAYSVGPYAGHWQLLCVLRQPSVTTGTCPSFC